MTTIPLVDEAQAPLLARSYYANGDPGVLVKSFAHVPELLRATMPLLSAVYGPSAMPARLKEIVVLRASANMQCRYCIKTHTAVALDVGLTRDEVVALRGAEAADAAFPEPRELALLRWTDALSSRPGPVPDDVSAAMTAQFSESEIVELTMLAGVTIMLNRYCTALKLPASAATEQKLERAGLS